MAKSKWEKLSKAFSLMLKGIDNYIDIKDRSKKYNLFQLHVCADVSKSRPSIGSTIATTHLLFQKKLCPDISLKEELEKPLQTQPFFHCPIHPDKTKAAHFKDKSYLKWSIKIVWAVEIISKIYNLPLEILLYCPSNDEYPDRQDWFRQEDKSINFFDKLSKINLEAKDNNILVSNLLEPVADTFKKFLKRKGASKQEIPFAPDKHECIGDAIEKVIRFRKERNYGSSYELLKEWEVCLKEIAFSKLNWSEEKQEACFAKMKTFIYEPLKGHLKTKKENARAIDRYTAGEIILYFVQKSIQNPTDRISGQIACILWVLIWVAKESVNGSSSIQAVINLSSKQINEENKSLTVNREEIEISRGLMDILSILLGKQSGKLEFKLFPDINRRNLKNAIENASKNLFPERQTPITLESFCLFPHPFQNVSMPNSMLRSLRNLDNWNGELAEARISILKEFHRRKSLSKSNQFVPSRLSSKSIVLSMI